MLATNKIIGNKSIKPIKRLYKLILICIVFTSGCSKGIEKQEFKYDCKQNEYEIQQLLAANAQIETYKHDATLYSSNLTKIDILLNLRSDYQCPKIAFSINQESNPYNEQVSKCEIAEDIAELEGNSLALDLPECNLKTWKPIPNRYTHKFH